MFGGITTDRRASTECDGANTNTGNTARDNPNSLRFCDNIPPYRTTYKVSAAYQLPWDMQVSGIVPGHSRHEHQRQLHGDRRHRRPHHRRHDRPARRRSR